jgi:hypothetical protein
MDHSSTTKTTEAFCGRSGPTMRRAQAFSWSRACGLLLLALSLSCVIPLSSGTTSPDAGSDDAGGLNVAVADGTASVDGPSAPTGSWTNVTGNLANKASECGNLSYLSAKPDEDLLIAGIALHGLWGSRDGGASWSALGTGSDASAPITNRTSFIVYDPQSQAHYWESGIYNAGGVYETADDGATFIQVGDVHHVDLVSVDFSDPNRRTLLAGGHEQSQTVYRSTDGGTTWNNVGGGLPANTACSFPQVIDSVTYLVGCDGEGGGPIGVYRSVDGGTTWKSVTTGGGFDAPLLASDGSIYWSSPAGTGMARSMDQGQTWTDLPVGSVTVGSFHPIELPDGRIATIGPQHGTQYVLVSADHGATWSPATSALPFADAVGVVYSSQRKAFFVWHLTCGSGNVPVPPDAVIRFDFDYARH